MTAKYFAILTNYGAAQLANAVALGTKLSISTMAVGDGGGALPTPDPAQTKLIRETRRAAINQLSVDEKNANYIVAEQVIPENEGGWFIREIGLFDDNGGLIAVGNAPETYKPNLQEGSGRTQVIQMVLMVSSTNAITLKVDPTVVLATRDFVTKSVAAAIQESEARAAQTYQQKGDYVLNPFFKLEMLKKLDKADVVNQLGNDTGKAASQHLLTAELGKKASVSDLDKKIDYGNHTVTGGVDAAGNGSVNAAGGGIRFYRKKDGTLTLYSREAADGNSAYVSEVSLPRGKGEACIDTFTFAAGSAKYRDMRQLREIGITYTNSLARPIFVSVTQDAPKAATRLMAYVDGMRIIESSFGSPVDGGTWGGHVVFIVPAGSTYIVKSSGTSAVMLDWTEY